MNSADSGTTGPSLHEQYLKAVEEAQTYARFLLEMDGNILDISGDSMATIKNWGHAEIQATPKDSLKQIEADVASCKKCLLPGECLNPIFGKGTDKARVMFIGHWPDTESDLKGEAFAGPAGDLLKKIIGAMKLSEETVYLCNVIKCKPKNNKIPGPEFSKECISFLNRQIDIIKPEVICSLGAYPTRMLLNTEEPFLALRGKFHPYRDTKVMPTFHPGELLKTPEHKRETWEDVQKIMAELKS